MKKLALVVLLLATAAFADVLLKNGGVNVGPVTSINCLQDGGILCARDAGSIGTIFCNGASATETGCVNNAAQTFSGIKTFSSQVGLPVYTHAALPAGCAQGQEAYCSTDNTLATCNGSATWVELAGSTGGLVTLSHLSGHRIFYSLTGYLGTWNLPYAYTVSKVSGTVQSGAGASAVINIRITDGTNNCDVAVHCDTAAIDAPTGSCTFAANTVVAVAASSDACTTPIVLRSDLTIAGYK